MPQRRVLVILVPQVHLLDLAGPVQTFYEAAGMGAPYAISHHALSPSVRSAQGLVLGALDPPPDPLPGDLVLVPGIMEVARDLLHSPALTVESIAASCGFQDARQLRRLWRRRFGTSLAEGRTPASTSSMRH